jgi:type IV pilus assembly protein PilM
MFGLGSVWGIDLAQTGLKAVKLRKQGGRPVVDDFVILRYSELTTDTAVQREDLLRLGLRQLEPRIGKSPIVIGIPSENVLSRFISLPPVEKRRIPDIVQYEARQQIPFDLNEVLWDYQRVRKDVVPGEEIDIGLFALRRDHVYSYLADMGAMAGNLRGVQIGPLAAYNFVRYDVAPTEPLIIVDMGAKATDLVIIEGDKFWLRNLRVAGNSFTQAIQRKFNVTFEDAENVKKNMGASKHRARIFEVITPVAQELVNEIQRSIGYYKSLSKEVRLEQILILGECYKVAGLDRFMSDRLQYRIQALQETHNVAVDEMRRDDFMKALPALGTALGLALQGLGFSAVTVDFLPEEFIIRREVKKKRYSAVAGVAALWLAFGSMWAGNNNGVGRMQAYQDKGGQVIQSVKRDEQEHAAEKAKATTERITGLLGLDKNRDIWSVWLQGITSGIPREVQVIGLSWASSARTMAATPMGGPQPVPATGGVANNRYINFTAYTDATYLEDMLKKTLVDKLNAVEIFPEKVKMFKQVTVGQVTIDMTGVGLGGAMGAMAGMGPAGEEPMAAAAPMAGMPTAVTQGPRLKADVTLELYSEEELSKERANKAAEARRAAR